MKKTFLLFSLSVIFLGALLLNSCASEKNFIVEKRHYESGYYVHIGKNHSEKNVVDEKKNLVDEKKNLSVSFTENNVAAENPVTQNNFVSTASGVTELKTSLRSHKSVKGNIIEPSPGENKIQKIFLPKSKTKPAEDSLTLILLVLLAIIISPLAVFIKEGATKRFWIDLILWLVGGGIIFASYFGSLILLLAIVYAILIVADVI